MHKFFKEAAAADNVSAASAFIANSQNELYAFFRVKGIFLKKIAMAIPTIPFTRLCYCYP